MADEPTTPIEGQIALSISESPQDGAECCEKASIQEAIKALPEPLQDTLAMQGLRSLLFAPIPKVARALAGFDREQLGIAIEVMIAMLDAADPDPDGEEVPVEDAMITHDVPPEENNIDPDLEDATDVEDDFSLSSFAWRSAVDQPGCVVSDPPETSWTEWHTRGRNKLDPGVVGKDGWSVHEDAEEDDAPEDNGDAGDHTFAEDEPVEWFKLLDDGPGCLFTEPDCER